MRVDTVLRAAGNPTPGYSHSDDGNGGIDFRGLDRVHALWNTGKEYQFRESRFCFCELKTIPALSAVTEVPDSHSSNLGKMTPQP